MIRTSKIEKRKYQRVDCRLPILYKMINSSQAASSWEKAIVVNIARGGFCLYGFGELKEKSILSFVISLKNEQLEGHARVVWMDPEEKKAGCAFVVDGIDMPLGTELSEKLD